MQAVSAGGRVVYEPFAHEGLREAARALFGRAVEPVFDLSDSDYVIDFGADAIDAGLSPVEHQRQLKAAKGAGLKAIDLSRL